MGFFKKLFSRIKAKQAVKPELTEETVSLSELKEWYNTKVSESFEGIKQEIADNLNKIFEELDVLKENLEKLKNAQLKNPKIPFRVKQIMQGNRDSFLKMHNMFIQKIEKPEKITYQSSQIFVDDLLERMGQLKQSSHKGFMVLNEFFGDEVKLINKNLKKINDVLLESKDLFKEKQGTIEEIDSTREMIQNLLNRIKKKDRLKNEKLFEQKKLDSSLQMKKKIEKDIQKLKSSPDFKKIETKNTKKQNIQDEISKVKGDIHHVFSQIERPLKKYSRIVLEGEDLINEYVEDAVAAVEKDTEFKIVEICKKLRDNILTNKVELKDKEREKALIRLDQIDKAYFQNAVSKLKQLQEEKQKVENDIKGNFTIQRLEDLKYKLTHTEDQIKRARDSIDRIEKQEEKTNIDMLIEEIVKSIRATLNIALDIKFNTETKEVAENATA